jgi:UDP-2-acetamido-2-deoxy-ribo-hexuluronate aminotransferase
MNKRSKLLLKRAIINKKNIINFPIQMYDPVRDFVNNEDDYRHAINNVLRIGDFINGEQVMILENALANYNGSKYCLTCANGTDALYITLLALGIKQGDKVITSVYSWISAAEVISLVGAIPVFCDINEHDFNIDVNKLETLIDDKVKAIIPVSLFGVMANLEHINNIAKKHNIYVIEDGAQSFGASLNNNKSCNASLVGCTSFYPTKVLGCYGDGGAIFTNDDILAEKIKAIRSHGLINNQHIYIGVNSRLDTLQASILNVKLKYLDESLALRKKIAQTYYDAFQNLDKFILPNIDDDERIWSLYCLLTPSKNFRDRMVEGLLNEKINIRIYYLQPLHNQKCFKHLDYKNGDFPIAEKISDIIICLPCYSELTYEEQKYIISTVKKIYYEIIEF